MFVTLYILTINDNNDDADDDDDDNDDVDDMQQFLNDMVIFPHIASLTPFLLTYKLELIIGYGASNHIVQFRGLLRGRT